MVSMLKIPPCKSKIKTNFNMKYVISIALLCLCIGVINAEEPDDQNLMDLLRDQYVDRVIASVRDEEANTTETNDTIAVVHEQDVEPNTEEEVIL